MMNTETRAFGSAVAHEPRAAMIVQWVACLVVAAIFAMGVGAKFFNYTPEGSMALAEGLGVGRGFITLIGIVETLALVGILVPRTRALGALLAVVTMAGALFSHVTVLGFSGNPAAETWPLALLALVAAGYVLIVRWGDLPLVGSNDA